MTTATDQRVVLTFSDLPTLGITYSRSHIYNLVRKGLFPQPLKLGPNRTVFRRTDVMRYLDNLESGFSTSPKDRADAAAKRKGARRKAA